ncbi:hypothetical protein GALLO_0956 [Streptococcus gallolyticus UCN34]|uniref:Uncharacterized protein n=1 Tax=Streptococcus gallolyticus (strain UCN34) TaxID=637909 RepID=A0AA36JXM9_STRG3|nr:hypothetical protein GALLO_0956 [Streptococcus gallolyticus UCN34]
MECRISNSYSSDNFPYSDAKLEATNKLIKRNVLVTGTLTTLKKTHLLHFEYQKSENIICSR